MNDDHSTLQQFHWLQGKMCHLNITGRRPTTATEWVRCFYNADVFLGKVPLLKTLALIQSLVLVALYVAVLRYL